MNTPSQNMELPGLDLSILDSYNNSSKFDINVVVVTPLEQARFEGLNSNDERIIIEWEYNSDIFKVSTMNSAIDMYQTILETMVK